MPAIAAWLVARPQNAVLGLASSLAFTLMMPLVQVFSGAILAFLVLKQGPTRSMLQGLMAIAIVAAIALISGSAIRYVVVSGLITWTPVFMLATLLRQWRSVNLALQVSVIVAVLLMLGFFVVMPDPIAFWKSVLTAFSAVFSEAGLHQQADVLLTQQDLIAPQMTLIFVFTSWSMVVCMILLGNALLQKLPGNITHFGRFRDFGFGKVLAVVMAVTSIVAMVSDAIWIQNVSFLMFSVFWLQGLAIAHWLQAEGRMPGFVLVLVYVLLPVLNFLVIVGLAVAGYADAWFAFRRPAASKS